MSLVRVAVEGGSIQSSVGGVCERAGARRAAVPGGRRGSQATWCAPHPRGGASCSRSAALQPRRGGHFETVRTVLGDPMMARVVCGGMRKLALMLGLLVEARGTGELVFRTCTPRTG